MLLETTDWSLVDRLIVHDDGSDDGTAQFLNAAIAESAPLLVEHDVGVVPEFQYRYGSAPAVMSAHVSRSEADWIAKVDCDIVLCRGWLEAMTGVVERNPEVDCLGMEAGRGLPVTPEWDGIYRFEPGTHMGGVGLIRVAALARLPTFAGLEGWTHLQHEYGRVRGNGQLNIGWINPDLPVVQLDRVPFEPWASLAAEYVEAGWGRPWGKYHERADYWDWWPSEARRG